MKPRVTRTGPTTGATGSGWPFCPLGARAAVQLCSEHSSASPTTPRSFCPLSRDRTFLTPRGRLEELGTNLRTTFSAGGRAAGTCRGAQEPELRLGEVAPPRPPPSLIPPFIIHTQGNSGVPRSRGHSGATAPTQLHLRVSGQQGSRLRRAGRRSSRGPMVGTW